MSQQKSLLPGLTGSPVVSAGLFVDVDEYKRDYGPDSAMEVLLDPSSVAELWSRLGTAEGDLDSLSDDDARRAYAIVIAWMRLVNDRLQARTANAPFRCIAAVKPDPRGDEPTQWRVCNSRHASKANSLLCPAHHRLWASGHAYVRLDIAVEEGGTVVAVTPLGEAAVHAADQVLCWLGDEGQSVSADEAPLEVELPGAPTGSPDASAADGEPLPATRVRLGPLARSAAPVVGAFLATVAKGGIALGTALGSAAGSAAVTAAPLAASAASATLAAARLLARADPAGMGPAEVIESSVPRALATPPRSPASSGPGLGAPAPPTVGDPPPARRAPAKRAGAGAPSGRPPPLPRALDDDLSDADVSSGEGDVLQQVLLQDNARLKAELAAALAKATRGPDPLVDDDLSDEGASVAGDDPTGSLSVPPAPPRRTVILRDDDCSTVSHPSLAPSCEDSEAIARAGWTVGARKGLGKKGLWRRPDRFIPAALSYARDHDETIFSVAWDAFEKSVLGDVVFSSDKEPWRQQVRADLALMRHMFSSGIALTEPTVVIIKSKTLEWATHVVEHNDGATTARLFASEVRDRSEHTLHDPVLRQAMAGARLRMLASSGHSRLLDQLSRAGELPGGTDFDEPPSKGDPADPSAGAARPSGKPDGGRTRTRRGGRRPTQ